MGHTIFSKNICFACRVFCVKKEWQSLVKINDKIYCQCDETYPCVFKSCPEYNDKDVISQNHKSIIDFHDDYVNKTNEKSGGSSNNRVFDFESS